MKIEYLNQLKVQFSTVPNGSDHWVLSDDFQFSADGNRFVVPAGFWTDFASVPRFLWSIMSPYDLGVGCIPHDYGYYNNIANKNYWDLIFLSCMEKDKISIWKRQAAYYAVKYFGHFAWENYTECVTPQPKLFIKGRISHEALQWKEAIERLTAVEGLSE